ncbi:MAG: phage head spike fiber domain-containing protein [Candidatus Fonsibacter sp.]
MGWGIGIGIGWPNASAGISYAKKLIKAFKERVLSYPNSIFEAEACLDTTLTELNAIGLLKEASLVITPNAYNEGILYDVVPNTTLGDMNVVRATTATRVNSAGLIEVVPRNLLGYSEQFDNIYWGKDAGFVITPNVEISPSGTMTADRLDISATGALYRAGTTVVSGTIYTSSIYIKAEGVNIGRTITLEITPTLLRNTITLTGEWQRISASTTASTSALNFVIRKLITDTATSFYIWGAQLEQGLLTEYFPTTTRLNIPRIDYTNGSCPSLLVEPQRTNLFFYSQEFENPYWLKAAIAGASEPVVTANNTISPSGNMDADKIVFSAITALGQSSVLYKPFTATNTPYSQSFYIKGLLGTEVIWIEYTKDGVIFTSQICNLTTNWQRFSLTSLLTAGADNVLIGVDTRNPLQTLRPAQTVFIWGGQLEAGAYPTSYIPTVASIQTRNADIISKTGISSLIGQTEGTLFVEVKALLNGGSYRALSLSDNSNSNYVNIEYNLTSNVIFAGFQIGATSYFQANNSINQTDKNKLLITWQNGMFKFFTNGIKIFERNTFPNITTQLFNTLKFSRGDGQRSFDSMVSSLQLYKTALTDQECINLTTL